MLSGKKKSQNPSSQMYKQFRPRVISKTIISLQAMGLLLGWLNSISAQRYVVDKN
jgi:hypothetical protein